MANLFATGQDALHLYQKDCVSFPQDSLEEETSQVHLTAEFWYLLTITGKSCIL